MILNIAKFGPIENAKVEFAKFLMFTGDSNLGKSYVNYLMYYSLKSTSVDELLPFFSQKLKSKNEVEVSIESIQKSMENRVENFMRTFLNAPDIVCEVTFHLLPDNNNHVYLIKYEEHEIEKEGMPETLYNGRKAVTVTIDGKAFPSIFPIMDNLKALAVAYAFSQKMQNDLFGGTIFQSIILPPARGAFVGENYSIKEKISSSVGMYRMFLRDYDESTRMRLIHRRQGDRYKELIERLVNGKLISKEGTQYLVLKNGKELPLSAAASSIKELSPLLYALQANPSARQSFCIEEPEAHLHPQMQLAVADLLALCYSDGKLFQFTTHSDYIVQRVNQLIKLHYIKEHDSDIYKSLCEKYNLSDRHCIDKNDVKVYYFYADESGNVVVEDLPITEQGIPMVTFFEVVNKTTEVEDDFNNAIEEIKEK